MCPDASENTNRTCKKEAELIEGYFGRPFFLSFTIGIPFCIFKLLFGLSAIRRGVPDNLFLGILGGVIIIWATADFLLNAGRAALDLIHRKAPFEYCTIAEVGRIFHKPMVFLAIDTFLTFCIICAMLWSGWITTLTVFESYMWYAATTLNLISLSLVTLYNEVKAAG